MEPPHRFSRGFDGSGLIETIPETGSTSADLLARLSSGQGLAEGDWLVADRQTSGRGRLGRRWENGAGNFMGSTAVNLGSADPPAHTLALVAGLAVHAAVSPLIDQAALLALKWPNDLLLADRKLSGTMIDRAGDWAVVGIGVNLVSAPVLADRTLAAVAQFGPAPERDRFAIDLADSFASELGRWRDRGLPDVILRWNAGAHPIGTRLYVNLPQDDYIEGEYAGLTDDGALMLGLASGEIRIVHAGDVSVCREVV